jgi:hypothetical protein
LHELLDDIVAGQHRSEMNSALRFG